VIEYRRLYFLALHISTRGAGGRVRLAAGCCQSWPGWRPITIQCQV